MTTVAVSLPLKFLLCVSCDVSAVLLSCYVFSYEQGSGAILVTFSNARERERVAAAYSDASIHGCWSRGFKGGKQGAHAPDLPPAKYGPDEVLVLVLQESRRHDAPARRRLGHSHREVDDRGAAAGDGSLVQSPLGPHHPHVHAVVDGRLDDQRRQQTEHEIGGRGTSASSVRVRVNQRLGFRRVGV